MSRDRSKEAVEDYEKGCLMMRHCITRIQSSQIPGEK
jgi:hypothetical protein